LIKLLSFQKPKITLKNLLHDIYNAKNESNSKKFGHWVPTLGPIGVGTQKKQLGPNPRSMEWSGPNLLFILGVKIKYHKLSKTTPWHKIQKIFLYHGINYFNGHF
jgi:hypothetical protein